MAIGVKAIIPVSNYDSSNQNEADRTLLAHNKKQPASKDAASDELANAASSIVSISEWGKIAALTLDALPSLPASATPATEAAAIPRSDAPARNLNRLIVEMLSGRKIFGVSAADLQAVRASDANSDLLLRRIEYAALRAGFGIERQIKQAQTTVDQTTFQAKGVIRTADEK